MSIVNVALGDGGRVELHQSGEPWHQRAERERLARAHPGKTGNERSLEEQLWRQVSGQSLEPVKATPELEAQWARFVASVPRMSQRESELELTLFEQVCAGGSGRHQIGDPGDFPGKPEL